MIKYYTSEELEKGIDGLPSINKITQRNLRQHRKIKYTKLGNKCLYTREWIEDYLRKNTVEVKSA